ncbi:endonuclease III domain-containing protein [Micromonospora haikouensis]|uniref:endonuclease III domain-containing protein n=1 Tax=Micromonospora haikouensis TaxID=686309 RepID=UPI0037A3FF60
MSATTVEFDLPFATPPDLVATMDIQIPALAWQADPAGGYRRVLHLGGQPIVVTVCEGDSGLHVTASHSHDELPGLLRRMFPVQVADLTLGTHPVWGQLQDRYAGVIVMWAPPFEALVVTVLSQNRTGEIVRRVYPALDQLCGGLTPRSLAALDRETLRAAIRSAGPYKADRLSALAAMIAHGGLARFEQRIMHGPPTEALAYLESLPGVAHKTAACVLVFSARTTTTMPVDVHLFRVADRLGLARHDGKLTPTVRDAVIGQLLTHSTHVALAHFVFLLVGRTTCTAGTPACTACFLRRDCRYAGSRHPDEENQS